jgi:recombination protein RecT
MANQLATAPDGSKGITKTDFAAAMAKVQDPKAATKDRANAMGVLVESIRSDITAVMPPHLDFNRLKQMFVLNIKQTPKLLECDPGSLMKSLITAAAMGLEPDPYHGQVYLLPYGQQVQVIPGYKGLMRLVRNSGEISSISCVDVYANDHFDLDYGREEPIQHKPELRGPRGDLIGFYCLVRFKDGSRHVEFMTKADVERVRDESANYKQAAKYGKQKDSVWGKHFEEMGKKTVFRRAYKRLPMALTPQMRIAMQIDDAAHDGRYATVDVETGEVIDIWAQTSEPDDAGQAESKEPQQSRLDSFAGKPTEPPAGEKAGK